MPLRQADLSPEAIFNAADFGGQARILAAVSGGGDSLALLFLLHDFLQARGEAHRLAAATIDHALRAESAQEADYVAALCAKAGIKHKILRWQGEKPQTGLQQAARAARYALLRQAATECDAAMIYTAHTLEDQAETYAMRRQRVERADIVAPFTDMAVRGLAGMAQSSLLSGEFWLMRPLLSVHRADLRLFLRQKSIQWLDDPSNENKAFERVRIRQSMTPRFVVRNAQAAADAAAIRLSLSKAAADWGAMLGIKTEQEKAATVFSLDLRPLQRESGQSLPDQDFAALYLLLALCAALVGKRRYISPQNARLQHFLLLLSREGKGEKPLRISVSGAVLEKRKAKLVIRQEKRNSSNKRLKAVSLKTSDETVPEGISGLFEIVPAYDAPLYRLFCPFLSAFYKKTVFSAAVPAKQRQEKIGKFPPVSWQN